MGAYWKKYGQVQKVDRFGSEFTIFQPPSTSVTSYSNIYWFSTLRDTKIKIHQYWYYNNAWQDSTYALKVTVNGTVVSEGNNTTVTVDIPANSEVVIEGHTGGNNYWRKYIITFEGIGAKVDDTTWMDIFFGDVYNGTSSTKDYYFAVCTKGYSTLELKQTQYQDTYRYFDIYSGANLSSANFITTVGQVKDQVYQVDISGYDYILIRRNNPLQGTMTKGQYRLLA